MLSKSATSLALAALLAGASTLALAQNGESARNAQDRPAGGPSLMERAKEAGRSIADKTRNLVHRGEQKVENARNKDDAGERGSGAMGNRSAGTGSAAGGTDPTTRKERMDQAHRDWEKRQGTAGSAR